MANIKRYKHLEALGLTFLDRWIKTCKEMVKFYQLKTDTVGSKPSCLFCSISLDYAHHYRNIKEVPVKEYCNYCMWTLINGKKAKKGTVGGAHCYSSFWNKAYRRGFVQMRLDRPLFWRLASIWRISRWLYQLENAYNVLLIKEHYETHTRKENP